MFTDRDLEVLRYDHLFIDGEWVAARSGRDIESIDPATGRVWARVPEAGPEDADRAVDAARRALEGGAWPRLCPSERGHFLYRLAQRVREETERLAQLESRDTGLPIRDTRRDMAGVVNWLTYYAGLADKIEGAQIPARPDWHSYTIRDPVGVVVAITPWNAPMLMYAWKLGPALAAGCTVVLKPAEQTPVTALELARLIQEVGLPAGVVNVVPGYGPGIGAHLVKHPGVDKIAFTGEHLTAQEIMRNAAGMLKRVSAECGGKAPHVVFSDADLEGALNEAARAAFLRAGQSCAVGSRVFVQDDVYDAFVEGMAKKAAFVRVGDPLDEKTHMGPQAFEEQLQKTERYVRIGQEEGAHLVWGGGRIRDPGFESGYFVRPAVFAEVRNDMHIAQEEIFGPVASLIRFANEDELVQMANDVIYGLTAGIWTRDVRRAHRLARRLRAGSVWVNVYPAVHWMLPYGGYEMSGIGREHGLEAIHLYTEVKTVVIDVSPGPKPDPYAD